MSERYILEALQVATTQAVAASIKPTLPVKYVGRIFDSSIHKQWLEVLKVTNNNDGQYLGSSKTHQGLFRLLLHTLNTDEGLYPDQELLESIGGYFEKGSIHKDRNENVTVRITTSPNIGDPMEDGSDVLIALSMRYNYFKP